MPGAGSALYCSMPVPHKTRQQPASTSHGMRRNGVNPALLNTIRASVFNFTNPDHTSYPSQACAINGLLYLESVPFQEVINVTQDFQVEWSSVHPFHHHLNPYQLQELGNPYGANDNGSWQVGDWLDTLLTPDVANSARVRWMPGPLANTGTASPCCLSPSTVQPRGASCR